MFRAFVYGFLVIAVLWVAPFAQAQTNGLLLYMSLDDNSGDVAKNKAGDSGKLIGSPKWVSGKFGGALEFDGTANYVEIPADLSPQAPGNGGAISICAWVKVLEVNTDKHGQTRQPVVMKGGANEWEYALYVYDNFGAGMSVWNCGGSGVSEPSAANALPKNEWHHECGTFDTTNGVTVYVDGKEVAKAAPNANVPCDGKVLVRIASRVDGQFLKAVVDEVAIWGRVLSVAEIGANMNGALTTPVEPAGKLATTWGSVKRQY